VTLLHVLLLLSNKKQFLVVQNKKSEELLICPRKIDYSLNFCSKFSTLKVAMTGIEIFVKAVWKSEAGVC